MKNLGLYKNKCDTPNKCKTDQAPIPNTQEVLLTKVPIHFNVTNMICKYLIAYLSYNSNFEITLEKSAPYIITSSNPYFKEKVSRSHFC